MKHPTVRSTSLILAVLLAATAAWAADNPWKTQTFLSDYSGLKLAPSKSGQDFLYVAPGAEDKMARYNSVMVDQPEVAMSPDSPYKSAKPDDLKGIADYVRSVLTDRLKAAGYPVVEQQGASVLYVRVALTDMQLKKKKRGILSFTPVGFVVHGVKSAVQETMSKTDIVDMTLQAEVADSATNDVLGAVVIMRGASADKATGAKGKPMTFEDLQALVQYYADRVACRFENARLPAPQRINCADPAAQLGQPKPAAKAP